MRKALYIIGVILLLTACQEQVSNPSVVAELPKIYPDYVGVTIPAGIAPLNFNFAGGDIDRMDVVVRGEKGGQLHVQGDVADFDIDVPAASDEQALADIPSLPEVYEAALAHRPEIENSRLSIRSSDMQLLIAKAQGLPTINMTGSLATSTNSLNTNGWGNQMKTNFDMGIGATVSVPIFDNRSTRTAVNKAKLKQEQALLDLQEQQKQLYSTIEGYWLDAQTNQQKFRASLLNVASEQTSYELLSEQFRLGLKNIVELMNGKTNLLTSQQNMLQSKYMTILDLQLLKFYKGEI